ncbi:MAG: AbrB/MazE/SpoVT family DNA-binding domain-containing protein [Firmicutes bacterium]|nr:AbrB/MazE/SpoVT family DNA-binding domain-containing protein [Bacillota bacterium]
MQTRISSKGQITLPSDVRRQLRIGAGDVLQVKAVGENSIVLEVGRKPAVRDRMTDEDIITATAGLWKNRDDISAQFTAELRQSDSGRLERILDD